MSEAWVICCSGLASHHWELGHAWYSRVVTDWYLFLTAYWRDGQNLHFQTKFSLVSSVQSWLNKLQILQKAGTDNLFRTFFLRRLRILYADNILFSAGLFLPHFWGQVITHNALPRCLPGQEDQKSWLHHLGLKIPMKLFQRTSQVMYQIKIYILKIEMPYWIP